MNMETQESIAVGDTVLMAFMGGDIEIKVSGIPEEQPFLETDGALLIVDQYDDEHLIECDGEFWVTFNPAMLSPEGYDIWFDRTQRQTSPRM